MKLQACSLVVVTLAAGLSARAATYNGDLFLGFTTQSGKDFLYDIGPATSLTVGETWDVSSGLSGAGISSLASVQWGVIGDKNLGGLRYAWLTSPNLAPPTIPNTAVWGTLDTPARSIASQFTSLSLGQSVTPDASFDNSWNQQTIADTLTTQYHNAYENPNSTGPQSADFYRVLADGSAPEAAGTFTLLPTGTVQFIPEPGTYALLGMGLAAFVIRRRFHRNA